ncbi:MAG: ATP-binding cassette domain-containing protein [Candidatus Gracilibacteria bacterium]
MLSIELKNISLIFREEVILKDISLSIAPHTITSLFGSSGSGKTSLLRIASTLLSPTHGEVVCQDEYIHEKTRKDILSMRSKLFGYFFPEPIFLEELTVRENILISFILSKQAVPQKYYDGLLKKFEITHLEGLVVSRLSSGQRERVNFIRAIIHSPQILILDEPGANLDDRMKKILFDHISTLKNRMTILIATHDSELKKYSDFSYQLYDSTLHPLEDSRT